MQKEQLPHIMQTEVLSWHSSLFDVFHMLKIWEQPSMKLGKLYSLSHFPTQASQLQQRMLQIGLTLSRQQNKSSLQGEEVIWFYLLNYRWMYSGLIWQPTNQHCC